MFPQPYYYPSPAPLKPSSNASTKPRVGLAVICRCTEGNTSVSCLLQRRGANSCSPNKWSFPGGRLVEHGDVEEDGATAMRKKLEEECGHGSPPRLPPLIHIECCKSGKAKQTLYHIFVVDTSTDKSWDDWHPKPNKFACSNIDLSSPDLVLRGQAFPCVHGYSWANLSLLIEECYELQASPDSSESELQYGLVRWIYTYGEHILKILIARSPKIPHSRRLSNSGPANGMMFTRPRLPKQTENSIAKPHRYAMFGPRASLPTFPSGLPQMPPPVSAQMYRLTHPSSNQLSPTSSIENVPAGGSPLHTIGINETPPNFVLPLHHQGQPNLMFFGHQPSIPIQALADKIPLMQPGPRISHQAPGLIQHSPVSIIQHSPGFVQQPSTEGFNNAQQFPHPSSSQLVIEGKEGAPPLPSPLTTRSNIVAEVSPTPVIMPTPQTLSMLGHTNQNAHPLNVFGPVNHHEQALLPTATAQLPPNEEKVPGVRPVPVRVANSKPLLPNPPLLPHPPPPQQNQRKETVCKHFVAGLCPYGEKCWFAHPEPIGSTPRAYVDHTPPSTAVYGSQGVIPSAEAAHNAWMNGNQMVPSVLPPFGLASPPQSPLNTGVVTVPSGHLGALPPSRHPYPLQHQQLMLLQQQRPDGQFPVVQPIPMQHNPILRFELLTDLRIVDENRFPVVNISQQASRADQLYISFGHHVHNYKILFGGNRPCTQSFYLVDDRNLSEIVSCVHCSRIQLGLLVIGTETGSVSIWELKRGSGQSFLSDVFRNIIHPQSLPKPEEAITSLIHFPTFTNSSVVVAGTRGGTLTWYIAQPPQKTFSVLYTDKGQHNQHSVMSLQLQGSHLLSADSAGRVVLWSMQAQTPFVQGAFFAHSISLFSLHVVDSTHFLTVGTGSVSTDDSQVRTPSGVQSEGGKSVGSLAGEMSRLSVAKTSSNSPTGTTSSHDFSNKFSICFWQFPKLVSSWTEEGVVNSTSFHVHPPPGNLFLAVGIQGGTVKIFNLPSFKIASELHFPEMKGSECSHIAINHSRENPVSSSVYYRSPFRDLILTTVWSDGRIMVCQVAKQ